jgi:hypothetical protein
MFVLDNLACKQKLLLGMDFMNDHGLTINIDKGTITFPDSQMNTITADVESMGDVTALHCMQTVIVQKGKTIGLTLKPGQGRALEEGLIGFIYAHPRLQHGLILWEGVQVVDDGNIIACVTNTTDEDVELLNDTPMAMWDTSDEQDFEWADALDGEINAVVNALRMKPSKGKSKDEPIVVASSDDEQEDRTAKKQRSVRQHHNTADSTSHHKTAAERVSRWVATHPTCNALEADEDEDDVIDTGEDDWQWQEEHLHLDVDRVPKQRPDPGVDATVEELQQAWRHTWVELAGSRDWTHDQCAEVNGKLQLLVRENDRMRNIASSEEEAKELPRDQP